MTLQSIAIEGPARSGKTALLQERYLDLLAAEKTERILVLCSNYYRKNKFLEGVQARLSGGFGQLRVTTYAALVRNTLTKYWPLVEEMIASKPRIGGEPVIFPELSGFEASEYLVKKIIATLRERNSQAFTDYSGTERSLVSQLIRRFRLRAENRLARTEMRSRSQLMAEPCLDEVESVHNMFDTLCSQLRVFDNSKQLDIFHLLLETHPVFQAEFTQTVRHLIVDDVDETVPAQQHFVKYLAPHMDTLTLAADIDGGTRRGYLNAYPYDWEGLKHLKPDMVTKVLTRTDPMAQVADTLLKNWTQPALWENPKPLPVDDKNRLQWRASSLTRYDMLRQALADVTTLLHRMADGRPVLPSDIVLVMPRVDTLSRLQIQQVLGAQCIPVQFLTGTHRPIENPVCRSLVLLLQLANRLAWKTPLSAFEFKGLLRDALQLHRLDPDGLEALADAYRESVQTSGALTLPPSELLSVVARPRYELLLDWLASHREKHLETQVYSAFRDVISPFLTENDSAEDLQQLIRSLYICKLAERLNGEASDTALAAREWLVQVKSGIVSDTPNKPRNLDAQAILVGTPQKMIDFEIERPIHLWLDVSSREWSRTDSAPLYNAWVHSVNWDGSTTFASDELDRRLARTRAGHITRTLMLYATQVFLYQSELDDEGRHQTGVFHQVLRLPDSQGPDKSSRAILRADQQPILSYRTGNMAITAVPGAGKTFVNVELLLELLEQGIEPESILVLTYMESAARTLQTRLRQKLNATGGQRLPVISTIHSLAFRILTEDDHARYMGWSPDELSILDEIQERDILMPILNLFDPESDFFKKPDAVLKAMQFAKSHRLTPEILKERCVQRGILGGRLMKFILVYEAYQEALRREGKLDFTDLISGAITLLESRSDVQEKYRKRFRYIIEDEAQDSSRLLQRFIALLQPESGGNLIRTGDTNQSITTTFSTADTAVFRDFIEHCRKEGLLVAMNQSGRCAPEVIDLANRFITWASREADLCNAFQPAIMCPVPGMNPELAEPVLCAEYETQAGEYKALVNRILKLQEVHPDAGIALLVRGNTEINALSQVLQEHDIRAITYSDSPAMNMVFLVVVGVLALLENPADTEAQAMLYKQLQTMGMLSSEDVEALLEMGNLLTRSAEDFERQPVLQLYYHLQDLMRYAFSQDVCTLIVRLTELFFTDPQARSIGYLCALKAQSWVEQLLQLQTLAMSPLEWVNQEFRRCLERKRLPFKVVQDALSQSGARETCRFVQIMTLHKAKGQEFDFVLIPGMTERNFPSLVQHVLWNDGDALELDIDILTKNVGMSEKQEWMLDRKRKKVEEEARLVYVGLTRAKRGLFLSCPLQAPDWRNQPSAQTPSRYFLALQTLLSQPVQDLPEAVNEEAASYA